MLGPLLFLAYINDMPDCVTSQIKLFADDSLLYARISGEEDALRPFRTQPGGPQRAHGMGRDMF